MVTSTGALFYCLSFALIANAAGAWVISNYSIPCDTKQLSLDCTIPSYIASFSCFGAFDYYSAPNANATTNDNPQLWNPSAIYSVVGYGITGYANFLYQAKDNYDNTNNVCATFNQVTFDTQDELDEFYVDPDDRTVSGKISDGGKSGSISWKKTGNAQDTYALYWANTQTAPAGQTFATICSIAQWMNAFTEDQGSVTDNGDGSMTASIKNLDPDVPFLVVVTASRGPNTIGGVYDSITLGGKSSGGSTNGATTGPTGGPTGGGTGGSGGPTNGPTGGSGATANPSSTTTPSSAARVIALNACYLAILVLFMYL